MPVSPGTAAAATCLDAKAVVEQFHTKIEMQSVNIKGNHAKPVFVLACKDIDVGDRAI